MESDDSGGHRAPVTRRRVLQTLGGAGTLSVSGCSVLKPSEQTETESEAVTIALSTPESGRYAPIGDHERNGFELAVEHLNEGGGLVDEDRFSEFSSGGIRGKRVETVIMDTEGDPSTAETNVVRRLENEELSMFVGGVSGRVVRAHRDLADEYGVPYFVGTSTLDELSGSNCSQYMYREMFSSSTLARALLPEMIEDVGDSATYFQVYTDAPEGQDLRETINSFIRAGDNGWQPRGNTAVRPGSTDFEFAINEASTQRVDVVFLDLLGLDAVNAIQQAREILSDDVTVVVPFLTQSIADSLGERVDGIYGTVGWHENLDTPLSRSFSDAYQLAHGGTASTTTLVPPGPAQNAYGQVLLYASAVERAGSFEPEAVQDALEGDEYALGAGREEMRACDHQAVRPVPVVRGRRQTDSVGNYFELQTGRRNITPGCDEEPAASCEF